MFLMAAKLNAGRVGVLVAEPGTEAEGGGEVGVLADGGVERADEGIW